MVCRDMNQIAIMANTKEITRRKRGYGEWRVTLGKVTGVS